MENKSYRAALSGPYTAHLAATNGLATDYHAIAHPSLPNYLALTSGRTWGITDDANHRLPAVGIGLQLTGVGIPWRAYMEGMTSGCLTDTYPYALKHDPFAYYGGRCPPQVVPLSRLPGDLAGNTPRLVWITPGLCHDTHDCPVSSGDAWLRTTVPEILGSSAWRDGGVLFITWDEDDGSHDNHVATIVITPDQGARRSARAYTHYSLLATVAALLGVRPPGHAAGAALMRDLVSLS